MSVLLFLIFFFVSLMIIGLVLLQEGKGGGLAGMSTGMDGVMGARNPLRRWTAYFFVFFVLLTVGINFYLHLRGREVLPEGMAPPVAEEVLPEGTAVPPSTETAAPAPITLEMKPEPITNVVANEAQGGGAAESVTPVGKATVESGSSEKTAVEPVAPAEKVQSEGGTESVKSEASTSSSVEKQAESSSSQAKEEEK